MTYRVLVTDGVDAEGLVLLTAEPELVVDEVPTLPREELLRRIPDYDAIVGRASINARRASFSALPVDGRVWEVQFDDWMYLMDDKVMLNKAVMSKFGIRLGEVTLAFTKP